MIATRMGLIFGLAGLMLLAAAPVSAQVCAPPAPGIVGWWQGEGGASDLIGGNPGTVMGAATFAPSFVGQGFKFGGIPSDIVTVGNPADLQLQSLTIEAWISRSSTAASSFTPGGGCVFCHGVGGYGFGFGDEGRLFLTKIGVNLVDSGDLKVTDLNFHHVAVTKSGPTVIFYVDGIATTAPAYDPGFVFTTGAAIGAGTHNLSGFLGIVDEVAIYNSDLTADEIQAIFAAGTAGKCPPG